MTDYHTFTFMLSTDCVHCGDQVPINGPTRSVTCSRCLKPTPVAPDEWTSTVATASRNMRRLGDAFDCPTFDSRLPRCAQCGTHFPFDPSWVGDDRTFACPSCQEAVTTFPAPEWLRAELAQVVQLVGAEPESAAEGEEGAQDDDPSAMQPVAFKCPSCDGSLSISRETPRVSQCQYCRTDVYLPDGLWLHLHPVKLRGPWTIVYTGEELLKTRWMIASEAKQRADIQREKFDALCDRRDTIPTFSRLFARMLALLPVVGLVLSIGVLVPRCHGDLDLLQGVEGYYLCPLRCDGCTGPFKVTIEWAHPSRTTSTTDGPEYYCLPPPNREGERPTERTSVAYQVPGIVAFSVTWLIVTGLTLPLYLLLVLFQWHLARRRRETLEQQLHQDAMLLGIAVPDPRRKTLIWPYFTFLLAIGVAIAVSRLNWL